ncbi:HD domain-containing protein [Cryptosporangium arvum]|uniref:Putative domain HDIG-containing protein n=1 Tax=Cryptosporangium arvum DSM 44712 TaxID=927661 RepID=A0A010ZRB7_9ACTN|nr:HD domain-containing protein [Cryptosporangium arvum]EXG79742.1 putative domain HDIG-containing protein [Cryptosporangium arvum DSM 44712]
MVVMACEFGIELSRDLARVLLPPPAERWFHTAGVAARARQLASAVDQEDRDLLVAAAWLHDIGYADQVRDTGFHPLDGARYLDRLGLPKRLTSLVAHHSGARFVAEARGLGAAMADFPVEVSLVSDALTYADQTVGPHGRPYSVDKRMAEMLGRHGPDSPQARAHRARAPYLRGVASRMENVLRLVTVGDQ